MLTMSTDCVNNSTMLIPIEILWTIVVLVSAGSLWTLIRYVLPKVMVGDKVNAIADNQEKHAAFSASQSQKILDQNVLIASAVVANGNKFAALMAALDELANGSYGMPPPRSQFGLTKEDVLGSTEVRREQLEAEGFQGEELSRKMEEEEKLFSQLLHMGGSR